MVSGKELVIGQTYAHKGKYMGKYISTYKSGRVYDPDPVYVFEHGEVCPQYLYKDDEFTAVNPS